MRFKNARLLSFRVVLMLAVAAGVYVRLSPVWSADFPLVDGALFHVMAREIAQNNFALPQTTGYNAADVPFAYPPLALYFAALLHRLGLDTLVVLRWLPALVSVATLAVFWRFAREVLRSRGAAAWALLVFALLPYSFDWYIVGGGLTRATGFFFSLLALHAFFRLITREKTTTSDFVWAVLALDATLLTHPTMSWFAVTGILLMTLALAQTPRAKRNIVLAGSPSVLLISPWLLLVLERYGLATYARAMSSGQAGVVAFVLEKFGLIKPPAPVWLHALLIVFFTTGCWATGRILRSRSASHNGARRAWLLWWAAFLFAVAPRGGYTHFAVPVSVLVGSACWMLAARFESRIKHGARCEYSYRHQNRIVIWGSYVAALLLLLGIALEYAGMQNRAAAPFLLWFLVLMLLPLLARLKYRTPIIIAALLFLCALPLVMWPFEVLGREERRAMQWARQNTPRDSVFLMLPPSGSRDDDWGRLPALEWFPALSERRNLSTVQALEWLPREAYTRRVRAFADLLRCQRGGVAQIKQWNQRWNQSAEISHIYVPLQTRHGARPDGWRTLENQMRHSSEYSLAYQNAAVRIYARRE
jgi:hypothetical protein